MKSLAAFRTMLTDVKERYSLMTLTVIGLTAGIFVYFFYFLAVRGNALDERQYRVLNRVENRIEANLAGYLNLAEEQGQAAETEVMRKIVVDDKKPDAILQKIKAKSDYLDNKLRDVAFLKNKKIAHGQLVLKDAHVSKGEHMREDDPPVVTVKHDTLYDSLLVITAQMPFHVSGLIDGLNEIKPDEADSIREFISSNKASVNFNISVGALVRPLLRYDMFDQFLVIKDEKIIYETFSTGLEKFAVDTIEGEDNSFRAGTSAVRRIHINGQHFRVYQVGFVMGAERGWRIVGLKSAEKFAAEKRTIPRAYLFTLFIVIVFVILAIPFIKSMLMSRTERLGTADAIFSTVSLGIATSVVCILLLDGYMQQGLDRPQREKQLDSLSVLIEKNVGTEINAITRELTTFMDSVGWMAGSKYKPRIYPLFNDLYAVDSTGITFGFYNKDVRFDVTSRDYFRKVVAGQSMKTGSIDSPFFLDAIVSWREQEFRAVVSVPGPGLHDHNTRSWQRDTLKRDSLRSAVWVAALTTRLRSVTAPVLVPGVGFAIFDEQGNILFHSDSTRSLNENIIEECTNSAELRAAITGRASAVLEEDYGGTRCHMYVRPMRDLPYFIVTFSKASRVDALHGQVFGLAFAMQLLLFLVYGVIIFIGFAAKHRRSRLQIPGFGLSVFTPVEPGVPRYMRALVFNIAHGIIIMITAWLLKESFSVIFLFFISAPFTVFCNLLLLSRESAREFLEGQLSGRVWKIYLGIVIAANCVAFTIVDVWIWTFLAQFLTLCVAGLLAHESVFTNQSRLGNFFASRYKTAYALVMFMLVMVTCVLPVFYFTVIGYNKEKEIEVKTAQLHVLDQLNNRNETYNVRDSSLKRLAHYYTPFFAMELKDTLSTRYGEKIDSDSYLFDAFSAKIREHVQDYGSEYNKLRMGSHDGKWRWNYTKSGYLVLNSPPGQNGSLQVRDIHLVSKVAFFNVPYFGKGNDLSAGFFWVLALLLVVALYFILDFFVHRIFANEKYSRIRALTFDQRFFANQKPDYKVFVSGLPGAGKSVYFRQLFTTPASVHLVDFMEEPVTRTATLAGALTTGAHVILLDHFEHNITDANETKIKLELIEKLVAQRNKRVIIVSSIQPAVFLTMLRPDAVAGAANTDRFPAYEQWSRVFAAFYDFRYPLQGYGIQKGKLLQAFMATLPPGTQPAIPAYLIQLVEQECEHGLFLHNIGMELLLELHIRPAIHVNMQDEEICKEREDMILRIQKLADNYYRSVWNHLNAEEQFVLYDLAQDGLVNSKNLDIVATLIDKGLLIDSTKLHIMNRNFRNFVLSIVDPADLGKLEKSLNTTGNWSRFRLPLFFVVFTLLLFVLKSDNSPLFSSITGFTAIIPIAVAILSLFSQVKKKE